MNKFFAVGKYVINVPMIAYLEKHDQKLRIYFCGSTPEPLLITLQPDEANKLEGYLTSAQLVAT